MIRYPPSVSVVVCPSVPDEVEPVGAHQVVSHLERTLHELGDRSATAGGRERYSLEDRPVPAQGSTCHLHALGLFGAVEKVRAAPPVPVPVELPVLLKVQEHWRLAEQGSICHSPVQ